MKKNLNQKLINLIEYYNLINANFLLSNSPIKRTNDNTIANCDGGAVWNTNQSKCTVMDCAGVCFGDAAEDCAGECNGDAVEDCAGECGGDAVIDECGECGGDGIDEGA